MNDLPRMGNQANKEWSLMMQSGNPICLAYSKDPPILFKQCLYTDIRSCSCLESAPMPLPVTSFKPEST